MTKLVLLRGLAREQGHWGAFPKMLGTALGGPPVVAVDLAGNGSESRSRSPASVEALMAECRVRLQKASGPGPYVLVGLSLGGMVATAWMDAHPDEVTAGVLINTSLRPYSPFWRRMRPKSALRLLATLKLSPQAAERVILELTSRAPEQHREALEDWVDLRWARPVSAANALRQLVAAVRYRAPSAAPRVPVLVMASAGDRLVDPSCSRDIAARWNCSILDHPDAGHDLPLDDPAWVAEQIAAWISKPESRYRRQMTDHRLFEAIALQIPDALIFADLDGTIRIWNGGAENVFGFAASEALGRSLDLIVPERLRPAHWAGYRRAIENGRTGKGNEVRITRSLHKDGRRLYVEMSFGLIIDASGKVAGSVAIGRDCSARYAAEQALKKRLAELTTAGPAS